jgi:hypothetical protein
MTRQEITDYSSNKHTAIAFEEVHYGAGISRVYNGYLKSGSKQKLEKQKANLERGTEERGKERSYRWQGRKKGKGSSANYTAT